MFGCISFPLHSDLNSKTIQTFSATLEFWHEQWVPIGFPFKKYTFHLFFGCHFAELIRLGPTEQVSIASMKASNS